MRWLTLALVLFPTAALAKERTAGCAGFPRAFLRIESVIRIGAPMWNQGNQLGTYALYRDTTKSILDELVKDASCGPLYETLQGALVKAHRERTPGTAGWDLRHGFDAFMEMVSRGESPKIPAPREVERPVAPFYDRDCPDLMDWVQRAEKALADGKGEDEAKAMLADLKSKAACPRLAEALAAALKKKQGAAALDRFVDGQPPPGDPDEPPAILRRCTNAPALVEVITFAILRGAPRFDAGHPEACFDIYKKTAEDVLARYATGGRCEEAAKLLRKGLDEAKKDSDVSKGAWALRHAFDAIGEQFVKAVPQ
jgi:hypothetical protein